MFRYRVGALSNYYVEPVAIFKHFVLWCLKEIYLDSECSAEQFFRQLARLIPFKAKQVNMQSYISVQILILYHSNF